MEIFTRQGEPQRWPNPEKDKRRKDAKKENDLENKRFSIPSNPEGRMLLEKLRTAVKKLKAEHPEVVGFALHGSLIKGYATGNSDIDGYLIMDSDLSDRPADADDRDKYPFGWEQMLPSSLEKEFKRIISLPEMRTNDIGTFNFNKKTLENYCETSDFTALHILFLPAIGLGINEYRKFTFDKLEKMGKDGQLLWQFIIDDLWEGESLGFDPELVKKRRKLYPQTIEAARQYFLKEDLDLNTQSLNKPESIERKNNEKIDQ